MAPKVFIDTNVLKWGIVPKEIIQRKHTSNAREISDLHQLIRFAKKGEIIFYKNMENELERMWSTTFSDNRRIGDLLNGISMKYVEPPFFHSRVLGEMGLSKEQLTKLRDNTFDSCNIERFVNIKRALGGNKNDDAYHIYSAELAKLDYFLTLDKKLVNSIRNQTSVTFLVKILFPSELLAEMTKA